jgi:hypothetical protein
MIVFQTGLGIKRYPISKRTEAIRAGGMVQVVKCLPSKHKVLSLNLSTTTTTTTTKIPR